MKTSSNGLAAAALGWHRAIPLSRSRFHHLSSALFLVITLVAGFSPRASARTLLGVYYGNAGWAMQDVQNMEAWQGKQYALVHLFTGFCDSSQIMNNLFQRQLPAIWNNHNVPVITWVPRCGGTIPTNLDQLIATGKYDAYMTAWVNGLKGFLRGPDGVYGTGDDRRVYIRFAHEMNGNWYPWSANSSGQTPAEYIAMWRHVHAVFTSNGVGPSHVQWIWCVNNKDSDSLTYPAEQYYPGDDYVNWVGIDGYNWGNMTYGTLHFSWKTPAQIFDNMIGRLRLLTNKPIGIVETASSPYVVGVDILAKNQWIPTLYSYVGAQHLKMVMWFNENPQTSGILCCQLTDWRAFDARDGDGTFTVDQTTYTTYSDYRTAMSLSWLTSADPANPRLLTQSEFSGVL